MNKQRRWLTILALWLLAAMAHASTVTYVYTDLQGTPLMETDAQGHITARYEYTPYGVAVTSVGAAPDGPGYTGHVNDPETGLVYMQARYYDPMAGRFLSVDPVGPVPEDVFGFNRYVYTNANPIINIDRDGRLSQPFDFLIQIKHYRKEFHDAIYDRWVNPAKFAYRKTDESVNLTATAGFAFRKFGGIFEVNLLHPAQFSFRPVYGAGYILSADVSPKTPLMELNIMGGDNTPSPLKLAGDVEVGDGLHMAVSGTLDAHGNFEITPKFGVGIGELGAMHAAKDVSVSYGLQIESRKGPDDRFWGSR
ncbi:MAG: RHS repeat domain-containing protein [Rhodanobacter sp.]